MKLLIVTQTVDETDPILGFFYRWIEEFAKRCESIEVICLQEGKHSLPNHVRVHSLGKEKGVKPSWEYASSFLSKAYTLRARYDVVFVHMNVEYLVLAGVLWKMLGKKTSLWYTHGTVSLRLRVAAIFSDVLFTASPLSLRLSTSKKRVMGHGMDTAAFPLLSPPQGVVSFITVGRVSAVKRLHILIEVIALLKKQGLATTLTIIGGAVTESDGAYKKQLEEVVKKERLEREVRFLGSRNKKEIIEEFKKSHVFLHASSTGSLDKAPLEALLCGVPVVTTNPEVGGVMDGAYHAEAGTDAFATVLKEIIKEKVWQDEEKRVAARSYVLHHHGLEQLVSRIVAILNI